MTDLDAAGVLASMASDLRLQPFIRDGVVAVMPARQARRRLLLNEVALAFEPD
jgi:hypothetical protein